MMVPATKLDPNQTLEEIKAAMKDIVTIYDSIDIVVNNAGYVQTGILEEVTPEATFRQFQVNTFGPLNGFCAVLPYLCERNPAPWLLSARWRPRILCSFTKFHAAELDNPVKNMEIIYDVVTSSGHAAGRDLLALGSDAIAEISKPASQTLTDLKAWQEINVISDFSDEQARITRRTPNKIDTSDPLMRNSEAEIIYQYWIRWKIQQQI
ncbi:uncharacterized protein BDCG_08269 [Blastomyces dermatitidis ER-3]|uniref:Uncharacterized protein n=1 Tax=Ajellomyces dermatitidis (strain ER-3 / ATCC MYA-2586) TaxID=559297 RepID=A0ABP2ENI9_AJEDR|nr:uncharacterized protein BDCG_08269 [Blastomyces dermatitidis ER-3]EEQ85000.2 hypothetical protein BDCG_08269 [Blastomyces dermatitidis ER-3]